MCKERLHHLYFTYAATLKQHKHWAFGQYVSFYTEWQWENARLILVHNLAGVTPHSSLPAIRELEKVVGMKLIDEKDAEAEERRLREKKRGTSRL